MKNLDKGSIIKGSYWPEPVEIKLIEDAGAYVRIIGVTTISRSHIDQLITHEEFSKFSVLSIGATCSEEPWKVFLALETKRYSRIDFTA